MKFGLQYHYQQGKVQINHNRFLDYTKDAEGNLIIDPEQVEIVKRIYREYLEGLNIDKITAGLERDGILTGAGGKWWHISTINKILRNEKYIGDVLLQKTYTTDFLNKTRVKNNGLQYYVEGNHEAIIPKDIYLQVQEELVRGEWSKPVPMTKSVAIAAITASRKSSSAENAVKAQSKEAYDEIADEIFRLRELHQQTTVDTAARDEQIKRINDLQDYISRLPTSPNLTNHWCDAGSSKSLSGITTSQLN